MQRIFFSTGSLWPLLGVASPGTCQRLEHRMGTSAGRTGRPILVLVAQRGSLAPLRLPALALVLSLRRTECSPGPLPLQFPATAGFLLLSSTSNIFHRKHHVRGFGEVGLNYDRLPLVTVSASFVSLQPSLQTNLCDVSAACAETAGHGRISEFQSPPQRRRVIPIRSPFSRLLRCRVIGEATPSGSDFGGPTSSMSGPQRRLR